MYSLMHEVMYRHARGLLDDMIPVDQLLSDVWEPVKQLKIILNTLKNVWVCFINLGTTSCHSDVTPFGEGDFLEALFKER